MKEYKTFETKLKQAKGSGSSLSGSGHWWWQRLTAMLLLIFSLWFVSSFLSDLSFSLEKARGFLKKPWNASLLIILLLSSFYHMWLGLQVIIEDYVHSRMWKYFLLITVFILSVGACALGIISTLLLAFKG